VKPASLESLRAVRVADVHKGTQPAAELRREPDGVVFAYRPDYVAAAGPAVAFTLPLSSEPVRTPAGAVPAFFAGLLPEGRRLTSLRRAVKTSADDELSLLLAVGRDTIGDVRVVAHGESPEEPQPVLRVGGAWNEVRFADLLSDAGIVDPVGLPGVQEKVSGRVISLPVARAHERFLVKLDPPEFPHFVANEAYFLALAREARLSVVSSEVVSDADGRAALLVRRFDRERGALGEVVSRACEDGCQVLGQWPADKYNLTTEEVLSALSSRCAANLVALRDLFRQVLFAWFTGNGDLHAKNLSILQDALGEWRVAPMYDVPATVPYGDRTLALTVQGRTEGVSRRLWLRCAADVGLPARAAAADIDDLLRRTAPLESHLRAGALPFAQRTTADWISEIRNRRRLAA
jgi:serine/threonine-protein kinase HipA